MENLFGFGHTKKLQADVLIKSEFRNIFFFAQYFCYFVKFVLKRIKQQECRSPEHTNCFLGKLHFTNVSDLQKAY